MFLGLIETRLVDAVSVYMAPRLCGKMAAAKLAALNDLSTTVSLRSWTSYSFSSTAPTTDIAAHLISHCSGSSHRMPQGTSSGIEVRRRSIRTLGIACCLEAWP